MNLNKYSQEISFPAPDKSIWISMVWDGHDYYLLSQSSSLIYQYNCNYECVRNFDTYRQYNRLCYDAQSDCFWAASRTRPNTVFKLNHALQEIDMLWIPPRNGIGGTVTGLSHNCACHVLLVAFSEGVLSLDTTNERFLLLNKLPGGCITGVVSIHPGYIVTQGTKNGQFVRLFYDGNCEIDKRHIPNSMRVEQILYDPCQETPVFHSLITKKKCYSAISSQGVPCEALGFWIADCYRECCKQCCKQCCPCTKQEESECQDEISVMQSVALVEAALAHILNAEGEKLQKVLAETDDMQIIMCVNQQVIQTIMQVTHLEMLLYDKLSVLQKNCCESKFE